MLDLFEIDRAFADLALSPAFFRDALVIEIKLIYYLRQATGANNIVAVNFPTAFCTFGMHDVYSSGPVKMSPFLLNAIFA
jgi:hypothetical protein